MFIALAASVVFACVFAVLAATVRAADKLPVPLLDILQSIAILGFQAIAVAPFIARFPGNLCSVELAALFAVFTIQAWNMAFSLDQSLRTVRARCRRPRASSSSWVCSASGGWSCRLRRPGLLWNTMMSMSGVFVVASEAISVAGQDTKLPGVGSYIAVAIEARDLGAIGWAILGMLIGILLYDQLFFRSLLA